MVGNHNDFRSEAMLLFTKTRGGGVIGNSGLF